MKTRLKKHVNVRSFDFDGCAFNDMYIDSKSPNRLIEANESCISSVATDIDENDYDDAIFMIGSNRQSIRIDKVNSTDGVGSCFPALNTLCAEVNRRTKKRKICRVDGYLLADTYGNRPAGENFANAINQSRDYKFSDWLFDESKLTILYAQMHKIASENPEADITFDFYDDRRNDILDSLAKFFRNNRDLIPGNVKLRLHHYEGEKISLVGEISGNKDGGIDYNYQESIKSMARIAGYIFPLDVGKRGINVLNSLLEGDKLARFKAQRKLGKPGEKQTATHAPSLTAVEQANEPSSVCQWFGNFSCGLFCGSTRKPAQEPERLRLVQP